MLPDFGWSELLVVAIVLIVIVGPKDLPKMLRTFGKTTAGLRKMAGDFRRQFDEALKEAELDDVRQLANDVRGLNPTNQIKDTLKPLGKVGEDLNKDLKKAAKDIDDAGKPKSTATASAGAKTASETKTDKPKAAAKKPAGSKTAAATSKTSAKKATTSKTTAKPAAAKSASKSAATPKSAAAKSAAKPAASKATAKPAASKTAPKKATASAAKSKAAPKSGSAAKTSAAKTAKPKSSGDKS